MRVGAVLVDERLPFLSEARGSETVLTNGFDPDRATWSSGPVRPPR